jgi:purine-binding chemotaxis protein CheW
MNETVESIERQIVIFCLGSEAYGIGIEHVETVIQLQPITRIPRTSNFVLGVINLRGSIIPVVDLRARFGLPSQCDEDFQRSRIVIVRLEGLLAGLVVDSISEVVRIDEAALEAPSGLIANAATDSIVALVRIGEHGSQQASNGRLILLVDVERVLSTCLPNAGEPAIEEAA